MSEVARDLAWVGVGIEKEGGVKVIGPLGFKRSLAKLDFGGGSQRLSVWLDEELIEELGMVFRRKTRGAMRETLRLGILMFKPNAAKMRGPFGLERPLVTAEFSELRDERTREAYMRLGSNSPMRR